jgi:3-isopropylmalate/(R)-2-methylmalate dehydratase small subunit
MSGANASPAGRSQEGMSGANASPAGRSQEGNAVMKFTSPVVVVPQENIDTDQIIPARFLKVTDKAGIGLHLFEDRPDFKLTRGPQILVAGNNFGCGSSREHAVWALMDFGFKAVISTSFADIFRQNSLKNGLLPIVVDVSMHARLKPGTAVTVDLAAQTISVEGGPTATFPIDSFSKTCILENLDEIGYILKHEADIAAYESKG